MTPWKIGTCSLRTCTKLNQSKNQANVLARSDTTTNYPPKEEAWFLKDLISQDSEHQTATLRIELGENPRAILVIEMGGATTSFHLPEVKGGHFVAETKQFLPVGKAIKTSLKESLVGPVKEDVWGNFSIGP